jgi:nuclear pore complex protein Nup133
MVVVAPTTGKITFWENVDSAETFSRFPQRHQGVDGSVGKLDSGETVTEILDIEHAGYALIFSTGRIAQLTLRDSQGRPSINVNHLQTNRGSSKFLGYIFGGGPRKDIASIKARPSASKGQMEVVTGTTNGLFQVWDLSWAGQQIFKREIDTHKEILATLLGAVAPEQQGRQDVKILDFAFVQDSTTGTEVSIIDNRDKSDLLVLVAMCEPTSIEYSLLEVSLEGDAGIIRRVIPINSYHPPQVPKEPSAKLLLPLPGHTAVIQFGDAIVMASLSQPEETPETQLLIDTGKPPVPYQDAIHFGRDKQVRFAGSSLENAARKSEQSSCIFVLAGYGIIRVACLPTDGQATITARSKLEQATFFSKKADQILDFSTRGRYEFPQREVEKAAIHLSMDILTSSSEFVEMVPSSMEEQLKKRSTALHNMASHLRSDYPPLPFSTRWALLQNANKLASALQIWKLHEVRVKLGEKHPEKYLGEPLLSQMLSYLNERYKTELKPEAGERDYVRNWFVKDINKFEIIIPWSFRVLKEIYTVGSKQHTLLVQLISEADDFILTTYETAFAFREDNLALYGFDLDCLNDGILKPGKGYAQIPGVWTSSHNNVQSVKQLVDLARTVSVRLYEGGDESVMKVAEENSRMVRISCQIYLELYLWSVEQENEKIRAAGQQHKHEFETKIRPELLFDLTKLGQATQGMDLAEKYHDMGTLVKLIRAERAYYTESGMDPSLAMVCDKNLKKLQARTAGYFKKYGDDFAEAYYSSQIVNNEISQLFEKDWLNQAALTKFLRAKPARARLGWINEINGEKDSVRAAKMLTEVGVNHESNNWCKKAELSLAKLALLSTKQKGPEIDKLKLQNQSELKRAGIQDKLYNHFQEIIADALDEPSAVELLVEHFGGLVENQPALQQLLRQAFEDVVKYRVMEPLLLIDTLTLIVQNRREGPDDITGEEFWLALQVLEYARSGLDQTTYEDTRKLIWKRCFIRDDWETLNDTTSKGDEEIAQDVISTALGWTLRKLMEATSESPRLHFFT